jgi:hypothetical protein
MKHRMECGKHHTRKTAQNTKKRHKNKKAKEGSLLTAN